MNINKIVKTVLVPTLQAHSFILADERKNYMEFRNSTKQLTLSLGLNAYGANEMVITLSMGVEKFSIEDVLELYDKSKQLPIFLRDENLAIESIEMIKNILLQNNGELLNGDKKCLAKLIVLRDKKIKEYNDDRGLQYLIRDADIAWNAKNYLKFIKIVEPEKDKLPMSFAKKLEIAKRSLDK